MSLLGWVGSVIMILDKKISGEKPLKTSGGLSCEQTVSCSGREEDRNREKEDQLASDECRAEWLVIKSASPGVLIF